MASAINTIIEELIILFPVNLIKKVIIEQQISYSNNVYNLACIKNASVEMGFHSNFKGRRVLTNSIPINTTTKFIKLINKIDRTVDKKIKKTKND